MTWSCVLGMVPDEFVCFNIFIYLTVKLVQRNGFFRVCL